MSTASSEYINNLFETINLLKQENANLRQEIERLKGENSTLQKTTEAIRQQLIQKSAESIRCIEWVDENGFFMSKNEWVTDKNTHYSGCSYTTEQLFQEYLNNQP